ncbi:hypothetical protein [Roseicella aquatilis]|uniref:Phasin domain-containing protein n=1 Tax=Roseicella aquatilis TaxID=2527868 RepID=A0A4R4DDB9_9PROT|nr:hypothetical protein [Roseicella aquatilis]TCZ58731.1 hypothetical protein EXY23_16085 [Roseicella aquatilis]
MSKTPQRPEPRSHGGAPEVVHRRAAAQVAGEPPRQGGKVAIEAAKPSGQAATEEQRRGELAVYEAAEAHARDAGADLAHTVDDSAREAEARTEAVWQAGRTSAEVARRAGNTLIEGATAGGRQMAEAARTGAETTARAMPRPDAVPAGMFDMPQAFAGLLNDLLRANLRMGQELFRLANPAAVIEMQQRLMRSYLDFVLAGQNTLRDAAHTAEQARERQLRGG